MVGCVYFVRESVDGWMCVFCERFSGWLDVCIL
jgi:hypothetical protein